ncbi:MAG: hypothetical protein SFT81_01035 [Candidatus Caenarcaniphilales bacterium]|nr:hypothetical protein [Candidatus Caenarcaniphilales bacterium]
MLIADNYHRQKKGYAIPSITYIDKRSPFCIPLVHGLFAHVPNKDHSKSDALNKLADEISQVIYRGIITDAHFNCLSISANDTRDTRDRTNLTSRENFLLDYFLANPPLLSKLDKSSFTPSSSNHSSSGQDISALFKAISTKGKEIAFEANDRSLEQKLINITNSLPIELTPASIDVSKASIFELYALSLKEAFSEAFQKSIIKNQNKVVILDLTEASFGRSLAALLEDNTSPREIKMVMQKVADELLSKKEENPIYATTLIFCLKDPCESDKETSTLLITAKRDKSSKSNVHNLLVKLTEAASNSSNDTAKLFSVKKFQLSRLIKGSKLLKLIPKKSQNAKVLLFGTNGGGHTNNGGGVARVPAGSDYMDILRDLLEYDDINQINMKIKSP